ncbi:benzoyl-CoA 2,3-dioxygenase component B [Sphingobium wenxiniae]|jgi:benzoyl-CoA 2,3-dioxygenase component B|uniref:Benzoyl-CoA 2,3-dioxygenase component B n=1 Tax=Sphingobium wenxiniae (strain DSM 21828 / CGMCC 1.7748 / JZ-1) TaxID=595605 RepID=A0A562K4I0_SPHWJ|nr:benzoyl-CoA 2,3-epoxidase subunit BoxB [Sphingobium wenxiniae]MBB6193390.1 benzoyl-CoA 2,3-dioxygenase component B [Sphingobium wenxiniae]MBE5075046.1 benzoyl-CoA 2,3-epoxidase subunit BoxB [Erythrobacteraceae bacterium E2-1 Yellow Sea]TWH90115.1 benzoyl-CoA 2,3-dioxygenase component B [Sphingobium wenxiniae]
MSIDYQAKIPNNVDLSNDRALQRALEHWQPAFLDWWKDLGPTTYQGHEVYLRTATSVDAKGWATFGHVKMPDYRWGIFLADKQPDRTIGFGEHAGKPAWQQVPGEYRSTLRRLIVTQGDTEPASVEQQRLLALTAPSLYDMRNLFQVNVEEGRHLWAMVYLLHAYFGRDGREEAEEMLFRHSGDIDNPRILGTFNEPIDDWLSFYMFAYFTDRDGKYQLKSLAESGFDPLARTCSFMLTEEAHHMFVGETGVTRVIKRTLDEMQKLGTDDPETLRKSGVIDLPLIQRYINFWFSSALDLFGAEISSNAATYFANGLKGRPDEGTYEDHDCSTTIEKIETPDGVEEVATRNAMNYITRNAYIRDCDIGVTRWNRLIKKAGFEFQLKLPSERFNRSVGVWTGMNFNTDGKSTSRDAVQSVLPSEADRGYVKSLMVGVTEPGKCANWTSPPDRGINNMPFEFDYVRAA